ncbi:hypothetical protein ACFSQQ_15740 [Mesorhizobium kowhaii]
MAAPYRPHKGNPAHGAINMTDKIVIIGGDSSGTGEATASLVA